MMVLTHHLLTLMQSSTSKSVEVFRPGNPTESDIMLQGVAVWILFFLAINATLNLLWSFYFSEGNSSLHTTMATGIECGGALLGIIQFSLQLTEFSVRKYRSYRGARTELQSLQQNVSAFSQTLHYFGQTMREMFDKQLGPTKEPGFESLLLEISTMVKGRMREIQRNLRRVRALGDPKVSALSRVHAKVQWALVDGRDMKELLASLEPVKSTMSLVVNTSNTQLLMEEIAQLQRDKVTISKDKVKQL